MHSRWIIPATLLLLQGCVPVLIGGAVAGVSAAHDRRTLGAIIDDENIELKAASAIGLDTNINKLVHVNVTSMNGIVLLTGEATTAEVRDQVLTHLRAINGVRRVTNELRITVPSTLGSRSKDSLITSAVKSRFLVTRHLDPSRVKVVTETGVVYLMGLVTHAEGDLATEQAASIEGVTGVVKVFEYIDSAT
jgi:osmotically-inducible protein OsmY